MKNKEFKCGYITIIGKPNVGKSTLLNTILCRKVTIVSPIAGTTRFSIAAIKNLDNAQLIFFDTPGVYEPKNELEKKMYAHTYNSILDADIILFLISAKEGFTNYDKKIIDKLNLIIKQENKTIDKTNTFCVLNKSDLTTDAEIQKIILDIKTNYSFFKEIVYISALKNQNIKQLLDKIVYYLPKQDKLFEDEKNLKIPLKLHIEEIIREKVFQNIYQEVPKTTTIILETMKEGDVDKNKIVIEAYIIVERENHKAIIIGENGQKLKKIGTQARLELEKLLRKPVYLSLHVKLKEKWTKKTDFISQIGY